MIETGRYYQKTDLYRAWIEESGDGNVRILKRVKFKDLICLLKSMLIEMKKAPQRPSRITLYMSRSGVEGMSDNALEFIDFCKACVDIDLELIVID